MKRIIMLCCLLLLVPPTVAQEGESPRAVVVNALDVLDSSYAFTYENDVIQTIIEEDFETQTVLLYLTQGDVAADDAYSTTTTIAASMEDFNEPVLTIQQIYVDDVRYMAVRSENDMADFSDINLGWWRYDDLIAAIDSTPTRVALENASQGVTLEGLRLEERFIESVTEAEPEQRDGQPLRVFDVVMNARAMVMSSPTQGETIEQRLENLAGRVRLLQVGDFSLTFRLWIGADDGLLYRGTGESLAYYPYRSAGIFDGATFDIETINTMSFTVSEHGADFAITAPEQVNEG